MQYDRSPLNYDPDLMQELMADLGLTFKTLGKKAKIDEKTAKKIALTGHGHPDKVRAVATALGTTLKDLKKQRKVS